MKQTAFLFKSFLVVTMMGWTLMSQAQKYEIDRGRVFFDDDVATRKTRIMCIWMAVCSKMSIRRHSV